MPKYVSLADHKNDSSDYRLAQNLRRQSSLVEQLVKHHLRQGTGNSDIFFRHQHPIHPYVVDFACLKLHLVIEIDGNSHDALLEKDVVRENYIKSQGYEVMRFTNQEVLENVDGVVMTILSRAQELADLQVEK